MKVLIVDDEQLARERMARMVEEIADYEVVGEAINGIQAVDMVQHSNVDIVLLDIRMPVMDGLEVAEHLMLLDSPPAVIFTTAYDEYAIQAFDVMAVGYLLKPVRKEALEKTLNNATRLNRTQITTLAENDAEQTIDGEKRSRSHISSKTRRGIELIPVNEVRYFLAEHKYVLVGYPKGEVLIDEPLKKLEDEFGERFLRIHRNSLIAVDYIEALEKGGEGHGQIRLGGVERLLQVSRRHIASVRKLLKTL